MRLQTSCIPFAHRPLCCAGGSSSLRTLASSPGSQGSKSEERNWSHGDGLRERQRCRFKHAGCCTDHWSTVGLLRLTAVSLVLLIRAVDDAVAPLRSAQALSTVSAWYSLQTLVRNWNMHTQTCHKTGWVIKIQPRWELVCLQKNQMRKPVTTRVMRRLRQAHRTSCRRRFPFPAKLHQYGQVRGKILCFY